MNKLREVLATCIQVQAEPGIPDPDPGLDALLDDRIEQLETLLMGQHDECGPEARAVISRAAGR